MKCKGKRIYRLCNLTALHDLSKNRCALMIDCVHGVRLVTRLYLLSYQIIVIGIVCTNNAVLQSIICPLIVRIGELNQLKTKNMLQPRKLLFALALLVPQCYSFHFGRTDRYPHCCSFPGPINTSTHPINLLKTGYQNPCVKMKEFLLYLCSFI